MNECKSVECNSADLTYYQRNRDVILNRAKEYYENDKERLREQMWDKYRNLSEEKNKKREYWKTRYRNMPEEKKLKEYQKNIKKIIASLKSLNIIINKNSFLIVT